MTPRPGPGWAQFLRSQAEAILALDLFTVDLLDGTKAYVLAAIEDATRRIRVLGATAHPGGQWIVQQARNLCMDLDQAGADVKFVLHDRDAIFPEGFDTVFTAAGLRIVRSGVQMPRMNSIMERWIGGCRRELLDRTLIWEPAPPPQDPGGLRASPQRPPASYGPIQRRTAQAASSRDNRPRGIPGPATRPGRRRHLRVPARRLKSENDVFGKDGPAELGNLLDRVSPAGADRNKSHLPGLVEPLAGQLGRIHLAGSPELRAVRVIVIRAESARSRMLPSAALGPAQLRTVT